MFSSLSIISNYSCIYSSSLILYYLVNIIYSSSLVSILVNSISYLVNSLSSWYSIIIVSQYLCSWFYRLILLVNSLYYVPLFVPLLVSSNIICISCTIIRVLVVVIIYSSIGLMGILFVVLVYSISCIICIRSSISNSLMGIDYVSYYIRSILVYYVISLILVRSELYQLSSAVITSQTCISLCKYLIIISIKFFTFFNSSILSSIIILSSILCISVIVLSSSL